MAGLYQFRLAWFFAHLLWRAWRARVVNDEQRAAEITERYALAIQGWQAVHGASAMDMTPVQTTRFRAWEAAHGDVDAARALVACRELMRGRAR